MIFNCNMIVPEAAEAKEKLQVNKTRRQQKKHVHLDTSSVSRMYKNSPGVSSFHT